MAQRRGYSCYAGGAEGRAGKYPSVRTAASRRSAVIRRSRTVLYMGHFPVPASGKAGRVPRRALPVRAGHPSDQAGLRRCATIQASDSCSVLKKASGARLLDTTLIARSTSVSTVRTAREPP